MEAEDKLTVFRFDVQSAGSGCYLQQTWERREMRPGWIPLIQREAGWSTTSCQCVWFVGVSLYTEK